MSASEEIAYTLGRLQTEFEDLAVGGLRATGPERVAALQALSEELNGLGAAHLAMRLKVLAEAIQNGRRESASALMLAQASVRVFERLVTIEHCAAQLRAAGAAGADGSAQDGDQG